MENWDVNMVKQFIFLILLFSNAAVYSVVKTESESKNLFNYDFHYNFIPGKADRVMICFHPYNGDYKIADYLKSHFNLEENLVSFNFPDYKIESRKKELSTVTHGTIDELLPALYVLRKWVIDDGQTVIDLYGYSAGGGVVVNVIGVLNTHSYDLSLEKIGINAEGKKKILNAIQKGNILLDTPLKSMEEIIAFRGDTPEFRYVARQYEKNDLRPIDSLKKLENLSLNIWVHFQENDMTLSNRDDALYIEKIKKINSKGKTHVVLGKDGGHSLPHPSLWKAYKNKKE